MGVMRLLTGLLVIGGELVVAGIASFPSLLSTSFFTKMSGLSFSEASSGMSASFCIPELEVPCLVTAFPSAKKIQNKKTIRSSNKEWTNVPLAWSHQDHLRTRRSKLGIQISTQVAKFPSCSRTLRSSPILTSLMRARGGMVGFSHKRAYTW